MAFAAWEVNATVAAAAAASDVLAVCAEGRLAPLEGGAAVSLQGQACVCLSLSVFE